MKIRKGFVSNSSSSSFTVIHSGVDFDKFETLPKDLYCAAGYLEGGHDFFPVNKELFDYFKRNGRDYTSEYCDERVYLTFSQVHLSTEGCVVLTQNVLGQIPPGSKLEVMDVDQYQSDTLKDFKNLYKPVEKGLFD